MGLDADKRGLVASDDAFDEWAAQHTWSSGRLAEVEVDDV